MIVFWIPSSVYLTSGDMGRAVSILIFNPCDSGENPNPKTPSLTSLTYKPELSQSASHILSTSPIPPISMNGWIAEGRGDFAGTSGKESLFFSWWLWSQRGHRELALSVGTVLVPSCYLVESKSETSIGECSINTWRERKFWPQHFSLESSHTWYQH